MTLNFWSNAGQYEIYNVVSPAYADLSNGYSYSIALINPTEADITAGSITIQTAFRTEADPCLPDTFEDLDLIPECDGLPNAPSGPATLTFSEENRIPAGGQCHVSAPCPGPFVRVVVNDAAGLLAFAVVTRLRGTAMAGMAA